MPLNNLNIKKRKLDQTAGIRDTGTGIDMGTGTDSYEFLEPRFDKGIHDTDYIS